MTHLQGLWSRTQTPTPAIARERYRSSGEKKQCRESLPLIPAMPPSIPASITSRLASLDSVTIVCQQAVKCAANAVDELQESQTAAARLLHSSPMQSNHTVEMHSVDHPCQTTVLHHRICETANEREEKKPRGNKSNGNQQSEQGNPLHWARVSKPIPLPNPHPQWHVPHVAFRPVTRAMALSRSCGNSIFFHLLLLPTPILQFASLS